MDDKPRNLKEMLSEAKDTSELMVDLGYAALFFGDDGMADEVHELEEVLSELVHEMRSVCILGARSPRDADSEAAVAAVLEEVRAICARRKVRVEARKLHDEPVAVCAPWMQEALAAAITAEGVKVRRLPSGAGHDGMALQAIAPIGMLFVRCRHGISHNPAEAITEADAGLATRVLFRFIENFNGAR